MARNMPEPLIPIIFSLLAACMVWNYYSWHKLREVLKNYDLPFSSILNPMGLNNDLHTIIDLIKETDSIDEKKKLKRIKNIAQLSFVSPFLVMLVIGLFFLMIK